MTCNENCIHYPVCKEKDYDFAQIDECSFYMEQKSERPHGEWIPCSERLPKEENEPYITTLDYGNGCIGVGQRFFFNSEIGWNDDCVIAWMPLPKPYMKGGE